MRLRIAASLALLASAIPALCQTPNTCRGRVVIDTVYQRGVANSQYEYFIQIRNASREPIVADVAMTHFPANVTLFSPRLAGIRLAAHENKQVRFGRGANSTINAGSVRTAYDTMPTGTQTSVTVLNCRER